MALIVCAECGKEFSDKAPACPNCGCPTEIIIGANSNQTLSQGYQGSASTDDDKQGKMLRDYLEQIRRLETDCYTYDQIVINLKRQKMDKIPPVGGDDPRKYDYKLWYVMQHYTLEAEYIEQDWGAIPEYYLVNNEKHRRTAKVRYDKEECYKLGYPCAISLEFGGLRKVKYETLEEYIAERTRKLKSETWYNPYLKGLKGLGLNAKKGLEVLKKKNDFATNKEEYIEKWKADYNSLVTATVEHNEEVKRKERVAQQEYDAAVNAWNEQVVQNTARFKMNNHMIDVQVAAAEEARKATTEALNKLFAIGIIHPKYRGIVPITMFCEYMDTGRRSTLEGIHGMYDLYETELAAQKIVSELSAVNKNLLNIRSDLHWISSQIGGLSSQLQGIAKNQVLLHEEIARGNAISAQISDDLTDFVSKSASAITAIEDIDSSLKTMQATSEMTAFNTAATARRVDALAKIEEHKYAVKYPGWPHV